MPAIIYELGSWGYYITSVMTAIIIAWLLIRIAREWPEEKPDRGNVLIMIALAMTGLWSLASALLSGGSIWPGLSETLRNLAWLIFLTHIIRAEQARPPQMLTLFCTVLFVCLLLHPLMLGVYLYSGVSSQLYEIAFATYSFLEIIFAIGALVLLHNVYLLAAPEAREPLRLPVFALAAMWLFDLNLYTIAYISKVLPYDLLALRGVLSMILLPFFILAAARTRGWKLSLSRKVTFHFLSLFGIFIYLSIMLALTRLIEFTDWIVPGRLAQIGLVFAISAGALVLLPSRRFRAWSKVQLAKHFFQHRYDYREEWLRFTNTIGHPDNDSITGHQGSFHQRVIKAAADITGSPSGLLLTPEDAGHMVLLARFEWPMADVPAMACSRDSAEYFRNSTLVVELDELRKGHDELTDIDRVPDWLIQDHQAWAIIPLVHFDRLTGLLVLSRPLLDRKLDWEDFDLLRVVARQIASYLAEARSQQTLLESARFDEFNRRMAFIMHDIKNLVSQLSLVARNAERHADNPEFRSDMIETLQNSVSKLKAMISRLSGYATQDTQKFEILDPAVIMEDIAAELSAIHPVEFVSNGTAKPGEHIRVDAENLRQLLVHLVQNAIDASHANDPVRLSIEQYDDDTGLCITDKGCGMSPEFVHGKLFKPFISSKKDGFGIGAYEARCMAEAMQGRIEVESREGKGSKFIVRFPLYTHVED